MYYHFLKKLIRCTRDNKYKREPLSCDNVYMYWIKKDYDGFINYITNIDKWNNKTMIKFFNQHEQDIKNYDYLKKYEKLKIDL